MAEELDPGLLAISLSDDDDSAPEAAEPKQARIPGTARTGQSEEEFQAVRREYRVKVENGEVSVPLPFRPLVFVCSPLSCCWIKLLASYPATQPRPQPHDPQLASRICTAHGTHEILWMSH